MDIFTVKEQLIKQIQARGFTFRRVTHGSHEIWWNFKTGQTCVIPRQYEVMPRTYTYILDQLASKNESV